MQVLVIEDDPLHLNNIQKLLKTTDVSLSVATNKFSAAREISKKPDIAFIDINLHGEDIGFELLQLSKQLNIYSVLLTSYDADEYIEKGLIVNKADSYLTKSINKDDLEKVFTRFEKKKEEDSIKDYVDKNFFTKDLKTKKILSKISDIYDSKCPVIISGASGVGKGLVAELIHKLKFGFKLDRFYKINCAALNENLFESELFGHEKGAFSGANTSKKGFLELADGGTIFLDEIGTLSLKMQEKLLKAVEEKEFYRVGGTKLIKSDFRLITATSADLIEKVNNDEFKLDLFFRINNINIKIPSIKERKVDVFPSIKYFFKKESPSFKIVFESDAIDSLESYSWPGNTREIRSFVKQIVSSNDSIITNKFVLNYIDKYKPLKKQSKSPDILDSEILEQIYQNGFDAYSNALKEKVTWETFKRTGYKVRETMRLLRIGRKFLDKVRNDNESFRQ